MIYAWAKNAPKLVLPDGVAFHVGKSTNLKYLTLQVHYADVSAFKGGSEAAASEVDRRLLGYNTVRLIWCAEYLRYSAAIA